MITLNHTIVPALDNDEAAGFLAGILGLEVLPPDGMDGHFAPVRVNDTLTLEFMTVDEPAPVHLAFEVDTAAFDAILARVRERGVAFGSRPYDWANERTDHPLCARGFFFRDASGHLYEVMDAGR
ncbi:cysteine transferase [Actinorhabdospora filicis]|uniref:Cysteine transferase n=1 Tax=Actinorhabdospora filicis TaxID=1785913 RepID=A0A9W6WAW4_9ACTN|nr:VOC family protein [Actinorhabdospora filicis]GLZ80059.1 cysteine transferase [Actinorhabdospora filicis]